MATITEKGIQLDFPAEWAVVKYDDTDFYRQRIAGRVQQVRGMDVVGYRPVAAGQLLLIEIKDYRISTLTAEQRLGDLRQTVLQKTLNTLSGLYAAQRVANEELRAVAAGIQQPGLHIEVVLFLERPLLPATPVTTAQKFRRQNPQSAVENLELELTSALAALGLAFKLRSSTTMRATDFWAARVA
jgi:hypothetical protein